MQAYDLIGDIHGQADELENLLTLLGYIKENNRCYKHKSRKAIFLGDFIDRGEKQKEVLGIVMPMITSGTALSVMGNHEFNAIAYYTKNTITGSYLREHSKKNEKQHQAFLAAYADKVNDYKEAIMWFKSLPLWLDLNGIRIVHACWDSKWIEKINKKYNSNGYLTEKLLRNSVLEDQWEFNAIETLLKGKEVLLKDGSSFSDKDGNIRHHIRVRWWDQCATTYREAFMGPESARTHIPDDEIKGEHLIEYEHNAPPVFLGHYWMNGEPESLSDNIACLDYSVAKPEGKLVAYRWDGESKLSNKKYIWVDRL